ncbi:hypothetical protein C7M84_014023 [Penaeus vannamei]|uniref:Uncharacterized protein n=1 Tax=Penaeus vannamei TaxID=6689 RepID=A0A3R7PE14_PENVA|nr:hypothetical protein C7M84_014023 [Penaeus vannamei]
MHATTLLRSDFDAKQPERVIDVSSCVASLAFHPTNPAVFAIGTFNGEVLVYDLVHVEDVVPMATGDCGGGSVTTLLWVDSAIGRVSATRSSSTIVATTSTGYILEWTLNITKQELQLKSGFMLQGQDVPRSIRTQVDESSGVGIATASFNSEDKTLFVLGAEVGGMFLCSTAREKVLPTLLRLGSPPICLLLSHLGSPQMSNLLIPPDLIFKQRIPLFLFVCYPFPFFLFSSFFSSPFALYISVLFPSPLPPFRLPSFPLFFYPNL